MTEPMRHIAQPSLPSVPSTSFKKYDPNTAPIKTLNAPRGVTRIAGANAYAAKLAISPMITVDTISIGSTDECSGAPTGYDASPPNWIFQV